MATLHLICGKIAAGKSTLASKLEEEMACIRLSEDELLSSLYPNEITTLEQFRTRSSRLENALTPLVSDILLSGKDVVLDFHANTRKRRAWMRSIIEKSGCAHVLHVLNVADDVCKKRLRARNESNEHAYQTSDEEFDQFSAYFEHPTEDEGFNIRIHES